MNLNAASRVKNDPFILRSETLQFRVKRNTIRQ